MGEEDDIGMMAARVDSAATEYHRVSGMARRPYVEAEVTVT